MNHLETENVRFQLQKNLHDPVKAVLARPRVAVVDIVRAEAEFTHHGEIFY